MYSTIESIRTKIFVPRCATSGCHTGKDPTGSIDLGLAGVETLLISASATECESKTLVTPGDPDSSYLIDKLENAKPSCGDPMPGATPLHPSDVACIRDWIAGLTPDANPDAGADAAPACLPEQTACGTSCVDTTTDPKNCGSCGNVCKVACSVGTCVDVCPNPTKNCNGACVDTTANDANCGACGNACTGGKICTASQCACGASVAFGTAIQDAIFSQRCVDAGCHTGIKPKASLDLTTKTKSRAGLVDVKSSVCSSKTRVVPGDADKSYLVNKLTGVGMCAGGQMPKAGQALPKGQLDAIRAWICNGAPDN